MMKARETHGNEAQRFEDTSTGTSSSASRGAPEVRVLENNNRFINSTPRDAFKDSLRARIESNMEVFQISFLQSPVFVYENFAIALTTAGVAELGIVKRF